MAASAGWFDLTRLRAELREYVVPHYASLMHFHTEGFFLNTSPVSGADDALPQTALEIDDPLDLDAEPPLPPDERQVKGLTTTFTCLESLLEVPTYGSADEATARQTKSFELLWAFGDRALSRPTDWQSEGAARTYCRVRSLAPLLRHHGQLTEAQSHTATELLKRAWAHVRPVPGFDGIFEVGDRPLALNEASRYPPNAYLSYWALEALLFAPVEVQSELEEQRQIVELWLEKTLGLQISLHAATSHRVDPQQIAWAIAGLLIARPAPPDERSRPIDELIRSGLAAFFEGQNDNGLWPRGEPLFHYPQAGNAYCYPYETLAVLLNLALSRREASVALREQLRPYLKNLLRSYEAARAGARQLAPGLLGWCSGHHPHRTRPESWATASVYRYLQALRRLTGVWSREDAAGELRARTATKGDVPRAELGRTWNAGYGSAGAQLSTIFLNPLLADGVGAVPNPDDGIDPDQEVIPKPFARSAILFGPPGTGKTTLVEQIAVELQWPFVEITPAAFLDHGVDQVSARADQIFDRLMELDHVVVLLDEIDELIRHRAQGADPLERFFTTTMLPRLTKLWKQRRILFFVNTNSIREVDPAILRSQRFDAAIFVLPPSFNKKQQLLIDAHVSVDWTQDEIDSVVKKPEDHPDRDGLGWMPLIRWDQRERLVRELAKGGVAADLAKVSNALHELGWELAQTDWPPGDTDDAAKTLDKDAAANRARVDCVLKRFRTLQSSQRRDRGIVRVVRPDTDAEHPPAIPEDGVELTPMGYWRVRTTEDDLNVWAKANGLTVDSAGVVRSAV